MKEIYQQTAEEVLERVESRESGLTAEQVRRSREKCGWNELAEGKKKSILQIFFEQYKDFLVLILIASAVISGMLGDVESAAVIVIVITINAILGTVQTVKAEQSLQSLKKLSGPEAKVLRDGVAVQLPARELVVGDVICGIILQHTRIVGHIDRVCGNIRATDGYRCSNVISHTHGACAQCNHYICRLCIDLSKLQA